MYTSAPETEKATPCEACGQPGECEVWKSSVCYGCHADWHRLAPTVADVEARYPDTDTFAAMCLAYPKFTTGWLAKRQLETFHANAKRPA